MQVFINESSLHSQYQNKFEFIEAIRNFVKSVNKIYEYSNEKEVFKESSFFYSFGMKDINFGTVLKSETSLNELFFQNLQKVNPKSWQDNQVHDSNALYEFMENNFTNTSTAEAAERKNLRNNLVCLLLNFKASVFGESTEIGIIKNKGNEIQVNCAVYECDIEEWLIENKLINPNEKYDENAGIAPLDCQTVLSLQTVFEKTNFPKNNGRKVYRKIDNNQLWVVDSSPRHAGNNAHIEIFDNSGNHLGTSLYNKIELDIKYKKNNRKLNMG